MSKEQLIDPLKGPVWLEEGSPSPSLLARREMLSRILNAYLRETGQHDPYFTDSRLPNISLAIRLPSIGQIVYGSLLHRSLAGHHVYGENLYASEIERQHPDDWKALSFEETVALLLDDIALSQQGSAQDDVTQKTGLQQMILNSLQHMESYLAHASMSGPPASLDFNAAEQALLCGHPFHPTPKSLEGFSSADSLAYSPEYGITFPLSCFAAAPEWIGEDWLDPADGASDASWIPAEMRETARRLLPPECSYYVLLPCHPWQAGYLRSLESVQKLLAEGHLVDLGSTGPAVVPTSSVRTVWNPKERCFYKLSLHIRITNFIRENNEEQLLRTLDASSIVASIKERWQSRRFQILLEKGYRTLEPPQASAPAMREQLMSGFSMIVREAPDEVGSAQGTPYVIASLMEVLPGEREPLLFRAVRESKQVSSGGEVDTNSLPDWQAWFRGYAELTVAPMLRLYAETGISLEAHVQNSMLRLHDGKPSSFIVRDLEGISVNRELAEQQGWIGTIVQRDSPVLYSEEQARHRLKYYFFVNHLSHVVQRLAYYSGQSEMPFWHIASRTLEHLREQALPGSLLEHIVCDLLTVPTLPAKANLLSQFHQRGETPLYVDIPNPMRVKE